MNQGFEAGHHKAVICLFCGTSTSLTEQAERRSANPPDFGFRASIIRCHLCGKEALYLPDEIVDFKAA